MKFVACFIVAKNKILTLKRSPEEIEGGKFGLIGGGINRGEKPLESIIREIFEETKLTVQSDQLIHLRTYKLPFNGEDVLFDCYKLELDAEFTPQLDPNESENYEWITLKDLQLKENLVSGLRELISLLKENQLLN